MRPDFILFTDEGERVPFFVDREANPWTGRSEIPHRGWKTRKEWHPGFMVVRAKGGYRLRRVAKQFRGNIVAGSVYQQRAQEWAPPATPDDKRFPNIAAVEMYLRHVHG